LVSDIIDAYARWDIADLGAQSGDHRGHGRDGRTVRRPEIRPENRPETREAR
jgi:hypothetical protein